MTTMSKRAASRITSRQHPIVKRCRALAARRGEDGAVLLDGEHLVAEALRRGRPPSRRCSSNERARRRWRGRARARRRRGVRRKAADGARRRQSGAHAERHRRHRPLGARAARTRVLDRHPPLVRRPRRRPGSRQRRQRHRAAPTRSAPRASSRSKRTADPGGWKALRGAMGSTFRVPVARGDAGRDCRRAPGTGRIASSRRSPADGDDH